MQDEDWRFTNVAPIAKLPFKPCANSADDVARKPADEISFHLRPARRLVFVNGFFSPELSSVSQLPDGVKVKVLPPRSPAIPRSSKNTSAIAPAANNAFAALNQAFFHDGAFIYVPAGQVVGEPIQLIYISTAKQNGDTIRRATSSWPRPAAMRP